MLDKYNVKATFFVTNTHPDYQNMIAEEAKRGHTVAIHSASHKYNQIYTSEQAFFDDLEQMNSIIKAQTGNDASIIRFPGGSSNTVSKDYCPGIMTQLVNDVTARGLLYCDWNVSSGDANSKPISTEQVVQNVISGATEPQRISCIAARHKGFQCQCGRADHPVGTGERLHIFTTHHKLTDVSSSCKQLKSFK